MSRICSLTSVDNGLVLRLITLGIQQNPKFKIFVSVRNINSKNFHSFSDLCMLIRDIKIAVDKSNLANLFLPWITAQTDWERMLPPIEISKESSKSLVSVRLGRVKRHINEGQVTMHQDEVIFIRLLAPTLLQMKYEIEGVFITFNMYKEHFVSATLDGRCGYFYGLVLRFKACINQTMHTYFT